MPDPEKLAGLGHNQPPEPTPPPTLQEQLADAHKALVERYSELMTLAAAAPDEVKTEEVFKPLSDLLKAGRAYLAMSEAARKIENEESRKRTAQIDAWFKNPAEKLTASMKAIKDRTDVYLEEKRVAEEKRRLEVAEQKRKAAEEKALDALYRDALGELAAYDARKAEEAALAARLRKEAEARRADHLRDRAKRLAKAEPYLAIRAERRAKAAADEAARIEALRLAEEQRVARAAELQKTKDDLEAAKKSTAAARREETRESGKAEKLEDKADEHAAQADLLGDEAGRLGKRADKADRHAQAGPAAMSRERSEMGTVSSLTRAWKVISFDRDALDLNMLRGFLHPDAVETAVRGYMMAHRLDAGGPKLAGCVFEQVEEGVYR